MRSPGHDCPPSMSPNAEIIQIVGVPDPVWPTVERCVGPIRRRDTHDRSAPTLDTLPAVLEGGSMLGTQTLYRCGKAPVKEE